MLHKWFQVSAVLLSLWGLYVAFWNIASRPIVSDESIYTAAGLDYIHGDFTLNREHPPTAKYIIGLFQVAFGPGLESARLAAATVGVLTGLVIWLWLHFEVSKWAGLLGAALWLLLPRGTYLYPRVDRLALLDPFMTFFAVLGLALAWWWFRRGRSWQIALSGVALSLSFTSKVSGAVIVPAVLILILIRKAPWLRRIIALVVFAAGLAVTFVLMELPAGIRSQLTYMIQFQEAHNLRGHPQVVDGVTYLFEPWWANFWFMSSGIGLGLTVSLVVAALFAFGRRPALLSIFVAAALLLQITFYTFAAKIALVFYYNVWMWAITILAALGISSLADGRGRHVRVRRILAASLLVVPLVSAITLSIEVALE